MLEKQIDPLTKNKNYIVFIITLILLTFFMEYSYMLPGKINMGHDSLFHYRRFKVLCESLCNSEFPVYIDSFAFDYFGYGTKLFYCDLILLPFAYLANWTSVAFSYYIMWFIMTVLCGIFSYKSFYAITKKQYAASLGALFYTFSIYRLQDLYERSAFGETLSFTFIPIVFWGLYEIIKGNYKKWYIISIGFSLLVLSHNISTVITFLTALIILVVYYKDLIKEKSRIKYLALAAITCIILSAYYLFPFIEQIFSSRFYFQNSDLGRLTHQNKLTLYHIFNSITSIKESVFSQYFKPTIGLLITFPLIFRLFIKKDKLKDNITLNYIDLYALIGICYVIATLNIIPWGRYPLKLFGFIQFPWRLFEFASYFFSIASAYYLMCILKNNTNIKYCAYIAISGLLMLQINLNAKEYKKEFKLLSEEELLKPEWSNYFLASTLEYMPLKMNSLQFIGQKGDSISYKNETTSISNFKRFNNGLNFEINLNKPDILELPLIYYKGYNASINDQKLKVSESENGFVEIPITTSGKVDIAFTGTFLQKYSLYLTLLAYIILSIYILQTKRKRNA